MAAKIGSNFKISRAKFEAIPKKSPAKFEAFPKKSQAEFEAIQKKLPEIFRDPPPSILLAILQALFRGPLGPFEALLEGPANNI
jgi:hypothetical protein